MPKSKGPYEPKGFTVDYRGLGTISLEEFVQAVIADAQALRELYNVKYITASQIRFIPTDEYGDEIRVMRPEGGRVFRLRTLHYRPSCKDYEL